jgi:hypothetical protein
MNSAEFACLIESAMVVDTTRPNSIIGMNCSKYCYSNDLRQLIRAWYRLPNYAVRFLAPSTFRRVSHPATTNDDQRHNPCPRGGFHFTGLHNPRRSPHHPVNASAGTDHGTAAPMFLAGGAVRAGIVGDAPRLGSDTLSTF